ncbi:HNH endonuclease [Bifidobacterium dentium]|uniref:HNH nuclease domain-containing protein n=1 Tax=Bifidobacterium dentium ATCC 27679 TaxID=871562 RepID=E0Q6V4_9BIFI|nr:hypothetical protein HMPREF0168_0862 [Bifidobacterium dentium ATCC 27679]MBF9701930.1 HNH endonuclease [Bifidobacterium dentium]TFZ20636.1 HNH endonuclease [Bifidobacterium dentium]DAE95772.1 MAG TPA: HNH endonuclease [Caudoviricetes sp.]
MSQRVNVRRQNGAARARIKSRLIAEALGNPVCHLCGLPIDVKLPAGHPYAFEIDELVPVSKGGDPHDVRNCAPSHRLCNQRRGNKSMNELASNSTEARQPNMPLRNSRHW